MRVNMPVTDKEVMLTERTLIVSKTDLKGRITYINKDFLDISGFTAMFSISFCTPRTVSKLR